jgi:hypothetical protein
MIDRVFDNRPLVERLLEPLLTPLRDWLAVHPFWHWLLTHPLWLLGVIVLVLFLFAGLLGAIARLTEAVWLAVLQAPVRLVQLLFIGVAKLVQMPFTPRVTTATLDQPVSQSDSQERLTSILNRLDVLRQEQEELMQEVRSILAGSTETTLEQANR